ncbi:MAG: NAD-dependent epimerase/dehydratase family protein [Deltaproteobacteria bacterium]|nr:NAD-dependent epimerase/dehydratase family protein [Deltaproteobacteria bacterium]
MKALVTGAAGHLGTALTELLVTRGHHVRASLRGSSDPVKSEPLRKLGVEIVEADIQDAAAMARAAQGMDALFHLAAVFRFVTDDPEAIIQPAVQGAENALRAAKEAGIPRVVLTSSAVAVGTRRRPDRPLDERDWNDAAKNAYGRAKTLAERKAWALADEVGVELVCMNPTCLLGPGFTRHTPITLPIAQMLDGALPVAVALAANYVDTRDVALAHLAAMEKPQASGRYLLSGERKRYVEMARALKALLPDAKPPSLEIPRALLPLALAGDWLLHKATKAPRLLSRDMIEDYSDDQVEYSSARAAAELGWAPRPFEQSLVDTAGFILEHTPAAYA